MPTYIDDPSENTNNYELPDIGNNYELPYTDIEGQGSESTVNGNFYTGERITPEVELSEDDLDILEDVPPKTVRPEAETIGKPAKGIPRSVRGKVEDVLWQGFTDAFAPTDIDLYLILPGGQLKADYDSGEPNVLHLTEVSRLAVNSFRATPFARPIGYVNPKGFARATRTVAGSIGSPITYRDFLCRIIGYMDSVLESASENPFYTLDQLPPVDLLVMYANEYGVSAFRMIKEVIFTSEAGLTGIGQADNAFQDIDFIATDCTPIIPMKAIDPNGNNTTGADITKRVVNSEYFERIHGTEFTGKGYGNMWNNSETYNQMYANMDNFLY